MSEYNLDAKAEDYKLKLRKIIESSTDIPRKLLVGTKAYHQLGDISRGVIENVKVLEYFNAIKETEHYYIGTWVEGFGFFNVVYPKYTTRELTPEELEFYKTLNFGIR